MKTYKYKYLTILILFAIGLQAQSFDKKVEEKFKVNSDVELVINAVHTDVEITTWNKNEVLVEAVMEVEGVSKEEADKILSKWKIEALANKSTVKITSLSDNMDFNFDFDFSELEIDIPHIEMIDFDFDFPDMDIEIPDMPDMPDMEEIEFDFEAYKKDSTYLNRYKKEVAAEVEKFKNSGWKEKMDSVRNSEEFKRNKEEIKEATKRIAIEMKEMHNSKEFKQAMEDAKQAAEMAIKEMKNNKELYKEQAELAKEAAKMALEIVEEMKVIGTLDSLHNVSENIYFHYGDHKNSKIKIKKYIKIKVPKNATFDLNVRHGKLNIPNSSKKMSANISYGNFIGGIITGGKNELTFSNSPVAINTLISGNITLKNVPSAKFGTFSEANLFSNSSEVIIEEIGDNVALSSKFGDIQINNIVSEFKNFNLILDYSKATINLSNANYTFQINNKKSSMDLNNSLIEITNKDTDGVQSIEGYFNDKLASNKLFLTSIYSSIILN